MNKNIFILFIVLIISSIIKPQSLKFGFRVEPAFLFIDQNNNPSLSFTPYSLYLTTLVAPTDLVNLEVRPGLFLVNEEYSGFDIGAFIRFKILPTKIYIIAGFNNHSNRSSGHNNGGSYSKDILYKGIGVGFQKDSKLSFDLIYYWTNDKDYAYSRVSDFMGNTRNVNKQINGILKASFSLAWDIF